jgi:hypothetical protein
MNHSVCVEKCLKQATARAKSDVANKLVSMFLHEVSRRIALELRLKVTDEAYAQKVKGVFGSRCAFCACELEKDRLAVEHLEGMNRVRLGLHIPGNVVVACKECNREKRRDDQQESLTLAHTGWLSFLAHDGSRCPMNCKTCSYWAAKWADRAIRCHQLNTAVERIQSFQNQFVSFVNRSTALKSVIQRDVEALYREGQDFATNRIAQLTAELFNER